MRPLLSRTSKGQVFSSDLIFAVSIILILLIVVWHSWSDLNYDMDRKLEVNSIKSTALGISDVLVMTSGSPRNWTLVPENASSIGLVDMPREISQERWDAFSMLTYTAQREKLGTGNYDFWLGLKSSGGGLINSTGLIPEGDYQIGISRLVLYGGQEATLNLVIWGDYYLPDINAWGYQTL